MGISPYDSPFSLFWRKAEGWDLEPDELMATGAFLEDAIAAWFAERGDPNENLVLQLGGLYRSSERPWQLATPDRLLELACDWCSGRGGSGEWPCADCGAARSKPDDLVALLECKWVAYSWDGWGQEGTSDIPVHYRAQCQWQMDVMDVGEVFVCALGPGGFRVYQVRRDEKDLVAMREAGARFWQSLQDGEVPDVDEHAATLPILKQLNADIEDRDVEIDARLAEGWLRAQRYKSLATSVKARYDARLRAALGTAKTAVLTGDRVAYRDAKDALRRAS